MRTTITLTPEVAAILKKYMARHKLSLKAAVNSLLLQGFAAERKQESENRNQQPRFFTTPYDGGAVLLGDIGNIGALLSRFDEAWRGNKVTTKE